MTGRRQRRARRRAAHAQAKGDEPPDPGTITAIAAGVTALTGVAGTTYGIIKGSQKPKAIAAPKQPTLTPAEDTTLKPGQRADLINTGPSGILDPANTGRKTLLGN